MFRLAMLITAAGLGWLGLGGRGWAQEETTTTEPATTTTESTTTTSTTTTTVPAAAPPVSLMLEDSDSGMGLGAAILLVSFTAGVVTIREVVR